MNIGSIEDLTKRVTDTIDIAHLAAELQSKPVVRGDGEWGWRAMREDEAAAVMRLVGEAIGLKWAQGFQGGAA